MSRNLVISGASSGLGRALALEYAAPGVRLALIGRNALRLREIADQVASRGATVETAILDLRDRAATAQALTAFDRAAPVEALIAAAGVTLVTAAPGEVEDLEA